MRDIVFYTPERKKPPDNQEEMQEIRYLFLVSDHSFTLHENICIYQ